MELFCLLLGRVGRVGRAGKNLHDDAIFFLRPAAVALDGRVELINPALSALLPGSAREVGRNDRPPVLPHRHTHRPTHTTHSHSRSAAAFPRVPLPPPYPLLTQTPVASPAKPHGEQVWGCLLVTSSRAGLHHEGRRGG